VITTAAAAHVLNSKPARSGHELQRKQYPQLRATSGITPAGGLDQAAYVSRFRLWPELQSPLAALGDRLERPGKERITLDGTLSRLINSEMVASSARVIWELPGRLRVEQAGGETTVLGFDGQYAWKSNGSLTAEDQDLLDTFLFDSVEHFFIGQAKGFATRSLGSRFTSNASGDEQPGEPVHDLYLVTDQMPGGTTTTYQPKFYGLNSDTQLLELVRYTIESGGLTVKVEVRLSAWSQVEGQMIPGQVVRSEDGKVVASFSVTSASVGPQLSDGIFDRP
jgi:hypothetical protein